MLVRIADGVNTVADIARLTGYSRQAVQRLADVLRTGSRNPVSWILLIAGALLPLSGFGQVVSDAT